MIRGEPAIGRDQSREPRLYSVEPVWGVTSGVKLIKNHRFEIIEAAG
jgi:hypothetical protein